MLQNKELAFALDYNFLVRTKEQFCFTNLSKAYMVEEEVEAGSEQSYGVIGLKHAKHPIVLLNSIEISAWFSAMEKSYCKLLSSVF
jgi:hypothetical protein